MEPAFKSVPNGKRANLAEAKLAYFAGDFKRCLELCLHVKVRTLATASEVSLLTARAYLRDGQPQAAQETLVTTRAVHSSLDASLSAEMLLATARIRQNDADTGIAMLRDTATRSHKAHFAIRSEIALCTALGYWAKRDLETTQAYLELVDTNADIIYARALELQAWCYTARCDYRRAAQYFWLTLLRLDNCQMSDRAITATAISSLAIFAAELFDNDIARFVETRTQLIEWSSGLGVSHFTTLAHQALFYEFNGNTIEAYQLINQARDVAPTHAFEVFGWGLGAKIARNAGETYAATIFARRAKDLFGTLANNQLGGEQRLSMLSIAESCAQNDLHAATEAFATYKRCAPLDKMLALSGDPRLLAEEVFIEGVLAQARGERTRAIKSYRDAFEAFKRIGYLRRAIISAYALFEVTGEERLRQYILTQLKDTANYITTALTRPADQSVPTLDRHPVVASLSRTQREVVTLICLGKTNKEVAEIRNVGEQTIKNMLTKNVFRAFGVSSRAALVSTCLRDSPANGEKMPRRRRTPLIKKR